MNKPTMLDVFDSEKEMCKIFWSAIQILGADDMIDYFSIFHISNGQKAGRSKLARMLAGKEDKAMGVLRGVADYCVPNVGFLEAKRYFVENGKIKKTYQEPEQKEFQAYIESIGMKYDVFRTPQEGIDILIDWGVISK